MNIEIHPLYFLKGYKIKMSEIILGLLCLIGMILISFAIIGIASFGLIKKSESDYNKYFYKNKR